MIKVIKESLCYIVSAFFLRKKVYSQISKLNGRGILHALVVYISLVVLTFGIANTLMTVLSWLDSHNLIPVNSKSSIGEVTGESIPAIAVIASVSALAISLFQTMLVFIANAVLKRRIPIVKYFLSIIVASSALLWVWLYLVVMVFFDLLFDTWLLELLSVSIILIFLARNMFLATITLTRLSNWGAILISCWPLVYIMYLIL